MNVVNTPKRMSYLLLYITFILVFLFVLSPSKLLAQQISDGESTVPGYNIRKKCMDCLDKHPVCALENGYNMGGTVFKPQDLCSGFLGKTESSCSTTEIKSYEEKRIPERKRDDVGWEDEIKRRQEEAVYYNYLITYPSTPIPKVNWTLQCMGCVLAESMPQGFNAPYSARKTCIKNGSLPKTSPLSLFSCQVVPGAFETPPPKPADRNPAVCPLDKPGVICKNCNFTKLQQRMNCVGMGGIQIKEKQNKDDPSYGTNRLELNKKINEYIQENYPTSPFLRLGTGDPYGAPGSLIVDSSLGYKVNPLLLLGIAAVTTDMGTMGSSMECNNPWRQRPTQSQNVCKSTDKAIWENFGKTGLTNTVIHTQAERLRNTYITGLSTEGKSVRTVEEFVDDYNRRNPLPSGQPNINKDVFVEKMDKIMNKLFGELTCSTAGTGGGDLANANALSENGIACVLENTGHGENLMPHVKQLYTAAHLFNINPLFSLAIANKDSSLGTAGAGETCMNPGNMQFRGDLYAQSQISAGPGECVTGRWAHFNTYGDGMQAKSWLLRATYIDAGYDTIEKIINRYAPPSENDTAKYIQDVKDFMDKYSAMCGGI